MYAVLCRYIKFTFYWLSFTMDKRATKRKRVVLKIKDKLKVCRLAKQNVPKSVLMSQFKIGKSTLNDILRSEEKFTQFKAEKNELGILGAVKTYKAIKNGGFDKLDSALYIWFRQQREKGCPVTGLILQVLPLNLWRKLQALCCKLRVPVALLRKVWLEKSDKIW